MKLSIKNYLYLLILGIALSVAPRQVQAQGAPVTFQVFYDELSPYGQWVDYPGHGFVWIPFAGPDFAPYSTAGHWVLTDFGWTWVSDYPWGWAPFHYGRWDYDPGFGWFWIPGTEWGPAWVCWRSSGTHYGWVPLGPGITIEFATRGYYNPPYERWVFVERGHMCDHDVYRYYGHREHNEVYFRESKVIKYTYVDNSRHVTYVSGPRVKDVQRTTTTPIRRLSVQETDKPGQKQNDNQLNIYRPRVESAEKTNVKPTPRRVDNVKDVKPASQRREQDLQERNNQRQEQPRQNPQQQPQPRQQEQPKEQPRQQEQPKQNPQPRQQEQPRQNPQPRQQEQPKEQPRQQEQPRQNPQPRQQEQPRQNPQQHPQPRQQEQPRQNPQPRQQEQPRQNQHPQQRQDQPRITPRQQDQPRQTPQHVPRQNPMQQNSRPSSNHRVQQGGQSPQPRNAPKEEKR